ncbi:MAG TPA: hypothetical protein VGM82_03680 [Gemmatimonadaceae bacterium]|jgi:hypothetical protein
MTNPLDPDNDAPTPEFRSALERRIVLAYRAEAGVGARRSRVSPAMVAGLAAGAVFMLTMGLILGASTSYASAESLNERQRAATVSAVEAGERFVRLRMQLARTNYERVKADVDRGKAARVMLDSAQLQVDSARAGLAKLDVGLQDARDTMPIPRPTFALLRFSLGNAAPVERAACVAPAAQSVIADASKEPTVPMVELPSATTKSAETFGVIVNVREIGGGRLLVDDGGNRQVKVLESNLTGGRVLMDSARGTTATTYGGRPTSLNPFAGDSTMFANQASIISVIDPSGNLTRALALPNPKDAEPVWQRRAGVDSLSRIIFQGNADIVRAAGEDQPPVVSDSVAIVRADLVARRNDTIARVFHPLARVDAFSPNNKQSQINSYWNADPLREIDEWDVLTNGSVAIVRGHDYHVDIVRPDGSKLSGPKLPFDWRRVSDEEKTKLIDSAMTDRMTAAKNNTLVTGVDRVTPWHYSTMPDTANTVPSDNIGRVRMLVLPWTRPTLDHVFDYYPPVRRGSVMADRENHLWVLPNTSKQSRGGELVYDVINDKGEMINRVRLPLGRYVVGFGRDGTVYMATGSMAGGFVVERTRLRH